MSIFSDMVKQTLEMLMDDFSIFGETYDDCLHKLENVLKRCEETNLVLNWEKMPLYSTRRHSLGP